MRSDICAEHNWSPQAMARSWSPILGSNAKNLSQKGSRAIWKSILPCIWEMLTVNPCEWKIIPLTHSSITVEYERKELCRGLAYKKEPHPSKAPKQHARTRGHTLSRPALCRLWSAETPSALIRFQAVAHEKQSLENQHDLYLIKEILPKAKQTNEI